jgi:hypothetical protein
VLAAAVSLLARFRRSKGQQRQQLKWLAYGGAFLAAILVADLVSLDPPGLWDMVLETLSFGALYLGVGMAVLRHRLYDIDRLINRTLTYGLLTALLAAVYTAGVFLLGRLLDPATGDSALAVAAATLAVAALFQPLRRRVQAVVDRRFNRARYDAARTVEAFSARLRDQLDLDSLAAELVAVVDETVQPTSASLWLRPSYRKLPRRDGALQRPRLSRTDLVAAPRARPCSGHDRAPPARQPAAPPRRRPRLDPAPLAGLAWGSAPRCCGTAS